MNTPRIGRGMIPAGGGPAEPLAWPPPYEEIDSGIRAVVRALVDAGFIPISSCDGHGEGDPQVAVRRDDDATRARLMMWLRSEELSGCFVSDSIMVQASGYYDAHLKITWFGGPRARARLQAWGEEASMDADLTE